MRDYEFEITTTKGAKIISFTLEDDQYITDISLNIDGEILLALPVQLNRYNEEDNIITDDELADCDTPDEVWNEGGIRD